jgi:short-subunit dehydrogenase
MQVRNKVVLVTGATGGIGAALCELLAAEGAILILSATQLAALHTLQTKLALQTELGSQHRVVCADISEAAGRELIAQACQQAGGLDVLINLAGVLDCNCFQNQDEATINRMLQVNTVAPVLLTRQLLPQLLGKSSARIVNVGSIFGSIGHPGFAVYCASKAAIKMFSEALARELADTQVSVAYIAPRATDTPLNSDKVIALNKGLGNQMDSPAFVAAAIMQVVKSSVRLRYLGWPESLFVQVNALLPGVVHKALVSKLSIIKRIIG